VPSVHFLGPAEIGAIIFPASAALCVWRVDPAPNEPARAGIIRKMRAEGAAPDLGKCQSEQARAKQDKTRNGHTEKTVRGEFFTHGTPPICRRMLVTV
jgi:hypothetical protein